MLQYAVPAMAQSEKSTGSSSGPAPRGFTGKGLAFLEGMELAETRSTIEPQLRNPFRLSQSLMRNIPTCFGKPCLASEARRVA